MKCLRVILFCISRLSLCLISYNTKTFINCFTGFFILFINFLRRIFVSIHSCVVSRRQYTRVQSQNTIRRRVVTAVSLKHTRPPPS